MKINKNKILAIFITVFTIIVLAGITYTFFSASVSNSNNEKFSTETATMSLVFDDNDNGISANLNPGESIVKKFTIENTGTVDAYGKINWVDLVNTYTDGSLTWKLESSTSENGTYTKIKEDKVPISSTQTTVLLKDGLLVPEGETLYYKLTITLNNLDDVDQTNDINASMHSKFSLEAGKASMTAVEYINDLAKNGDKNSIGTFSGKPVNAYVLKFNGDIDSMTYDTLSECQEQIQYNLENYYYYGTNYNGTCELNTSTDKYYIISSGDSRNSWYNISYNLEDCQEKLNYYDNTTCVEVPVTCNSFAYDGTSDNNLRYVGANPCNYVKLNGIEFRMMGVMNNVDDGTGVLESRIKLVIVDELWEFSWGSTNNFDSSMTKNRIHMFDAQNSCMLSSPEIDNAKWYLRGISTEETSVLAKDLYNIERTTGSVFPGNPTTSIAKAAPFYPSDVVLASSGSESDRINCLNKNVLIHDYATSSDYSNCSSGNWFFLDRYNTSVMNGWTSMSASNNNNDVLRKLSYGDFMFDKATTDPVYHPSIYLSSNTEIISGTGLYNDPYIVGTTNCDLSG